MPGELTPDRPISAAMADSIGKPFIGSKSVEPAVPTTRWPLLMRLNPLNCWSRYGTASPAVFRGRGGKPEFHQGRRKTAFTWRSLIMSEVTQILQAIEDGDAKAAHELLPLVYGELRRLAAHKMANEAPGHTPQPTARVAEDWLRCVGDEASRFA